MKPYLPLRLAAVITAAALNFTALADQTWKGTTDNLWSTTGNWSGNAQPGSSDIVIYNNFSTANLSNWLSSAYSIKGIEFSNVPSPASISGSTLTVAGGGINLSNAAQPLTINAPVALSAAQTWGVATNQSLLVSGVVSGSSTLTKDTWGTLYLNGANTFTGGFTDNGGAVWINNSSALGGTGAHTVTVANNNLGAGLHLNGTNGNITIGSSISYTLSQQNGAIINEAGDNTLGGNIVVTSGGGYVYIVVNGGTLTLNGTVTLNTTARAFALGGAGNGTLNGNINNSTGLPFRKVDAGTWTLTNNNVYNGYTTVEGGKLVLTSTAKLSTTTNITVFANALLDVSAVTNAQYGSNVFVLYTNVLAGSGTITGNVAVVSNVVVQPGSLNVAQTAGGMGVAGTLSLSNSFVMASTATNVFELNTATTVGSGVNDLLNIAGNLDPQSARIFVTFLSPPTTGTPYRLINYGGTKFSTFNPSVLTDTHYTFTLDESVPNQVNVTVSGSAPNLIWNGTTSSSTWDLNTTANWNGNTSKFLNWDPVIFDDTAATNTATLSGTLQPASVTYSNSALNYLLQGSGKITGPTGLTKWGSGTLIITTSGSDYTGPVTINAGTIGISSVALNGSTSTLGAGTNITLNGGTLQFGGARPAASSFNRYFTLGTNGGTILSTNGTFFIMNTISGPGSLTKTGAVQVILGDIVAGVLTNAMNTYTGNTYITQGELQIRNAHALGFGKAVVSAGADLSVGGSGNYGTITNDFDLNGGDGNGSAGTLQVNDSGTSVTFGGTINLLADSSAGTVNNGNVVTFNIAGPIIGSGGFKKLGTNTVTLSSANNAYSGTTTISSGTLALGSGASIASSSGISIAAGGTLNVSAISSYALAAGQSLSASGTASPATIKGASGGTVNLGSQPIILTYDGSHPALTNSQGTLVLNGNPFTVNGTALAPGTYPVIQASANISSSGSFTVTGTAIGAGQTGAISVSGGTVNLIITASPAFSNLTTSQSIVYGTGSVTLSGKLSAAGPIYPASGETITISINGNAQNTVINDSTGDFSLAYDTSMLPYSPIPYTITYSYGGNVTLNPASDSSTTLTVNLRPLDITAKNATKECSQTLTFAGTEFTTGAGQLVNGNAVTSVTLTSAGAASGAVPGNYDIVPSAAQGSGLANYSIGYHNGTLTVADTTPPAVIYCFTNLTLSTTTTNCQALLPDLTGTNYIIAVDACSSSVTVTQNPPAETAMSLGTNQVVLSAFDVSGNVTNLTNTVIVADTTAPVITLLGDNPLTNECHAPFADPGATAEDNCAGAVAVTTNSTVNPDSVGVYTIDYVASDPSGNTATNTRTVYVVDTTPPAISCPANIAVVTMDPTGATVSFSVTALDNCDPSPSVVAMPASGSFFLAGTNTVTAYAYDASGNTNTCSFLVMVDRAPVVLTNLTASTMAGQTLAVDNANLLALVSDPDGDPLAVTSAGPTSTNGGTVTLSSTNVTYSPVASYVGSDLFSYVVGDGRGGFATNVVLVSVLSSTSFSPNVVYGPVVSNGVFLVQFAGIPGVTYTIEATDDLNPPSWTKKVNLTAPTTDQGLGVGVFEFSESVGAATSRYYRTVYPPY
ncbi:MAG TPA: HYR domain-containing protein [Candidatus Acidoferrum sp.]|nr:HYR domain-containing protein [Candidatus Acidoferrum sp.]